MYMYMYILRHSDTSVLAMCHRGFLKRNINILNKLIEFHKFCARSCYFHRELRLFSVEFPPAIIIRSPTP